MLLDLYPDVYAAFQISNDQKDNFQVVGRRNKDITPDYLWLEWKNGGSCPDWIQDLAYLALEPTSPWNLSYSDRIQRIKDWHDELLYSIREEFREEISKFNELTKEKQLILKEKDLAVLHDARVIGATCNGAAQYREILSAKSVGVVIVEEAGEVLEPHIFAALSEESLNSSETKHLILIGDHLQLRPKVENYNLTTVSGCGYDFDCSMFERLINADYKSSMLQVQHRMRPEISFFIRQETYPTLQDHSSVEEFPSIRGMKQDVVFFDHAKPEDGTGSEMDESLSKTKSNSFEAQLCVEMVRYFLLQGYDHSQITVLTPYVGQVLKIAQLMKSKIKDVNAYISDLDLLELPANDDEDMQVEILAEKGKEQVRCSSIDNFQGCVFI